MQYHFDHAKPGDVLLADRGLKHQRLRGDRLPDRHDRTDRRCKLHQCLGKFGQQLHGNDLQHGVFGADRRCFMHALFGNFGQRMGDDDLQHREHRADRGAELCPGHRCLLHDDDLHPGRGCQRASGVVFGLRADFDQRLGDDHLFHGDHRAHGCRELHGLGVGFDLTLYGDDLQHREQRPHGRAFLHGANGGLDQQLRDDHLQHRGQRAHSRLILHGGERDVRQPVDGDGVHPREHRSHTDGVVLQYLAQQRQQLDDDLLLVGEHGAHAGFVLHADNGQQLDDPALHHHDLWLGHTCVGGDLHRFVNGHLRNLHGHHERGELCATDGRFNQRLRHHKLQHRADRPDLCAELHAFGIDLGVALPRDQLHPRDHRSAGHRILLDGLGVVGQQLDDDDLPDREHHRTHGYLALGLRAGDGRGAQLDHDHLQRHARLLPSD